MREQGVDKWHWVWYNIIMGNAEIKGCPRCGASSNQMLNGKNRSGTQSCLCGKCRKSYTLNPKKRAYAEEVRELAIKEYYAGASGRSVGRIHGMSKANVYNWIKKNWYGVDKSRNGFIRIWAWRDILVYHGEERQRKRRKCVFNDDDKPKSPTNSSFWCG